MPSSYEMLKTNALSHLRRRVATDPELEVAIRYGRTDLADELNDAIVAAREQLAERRVLAKAEFRSLQYEVRVALVESLRRAQRRR